jgi:hypothetical protein
LVSFGPSKINEVHARHVLKLKSIYKNPLSKLLVLPVHKYRNTVGLIIGSQPLPLLVRVDLIESLQ